jgi:hypothetical protein
MPNTRSFKFANLTAKAVTFNPGMKDIRIEIIDKKEPINRTLTPEAILGNTLDNS